MIGPASLSLSVAVALGCASQSPQTTTPSSPDRELSIPVDLQPEIDRAIAIGQELYVHDVISARATDVLVAKLGAAGVAKWQEIGQGYITVREGTEERGPN